MKPLRLAVALFVLFSFSPPPAGAEAVPAAPPAAGELPAAAPSSGAEPVAVVFGEGEAAVVLFRDDQASETTQAGAEPATAAPTASSTPRSPAAEPEPSPPKRGRQAAIEDAGENYFRSGAAPVVWRPGGVVFPFGESQPIVTCSPLRACDIELEEGEVIRDVALGDSERWVASPLTSGEAERTVPHVVVKPKDHGLATNLVIGTTRRTYHLALVSPVEAKVKGQVGYDSYVSFYYPEDLVEAWASKEQLKRRQQERRHDARAEVPEVDAVSVEDLNFDYTVEARKAAFAPVVVFDDGEHVYIQLPASVRSSDLPALLVETPGGGGGLALSNYRIVDGYWYIVDGLFEKAELVVGVGKRRKKVTLRKSSRRSRG